MARTAPASRPATHLFATPQAPEPLTPAATATPSQNTDLALSAPARMDVSWRAARPALPHPAPPARVAKVANGTLDSFGDRPYHRLTIVNRGDLPLLAAT